MVVPGGLEGVICEEETSTLVQIRTRSKTNLAETANSRKSTFEKKAQVVPGGLEGVIFEEDGDLLLELVAVHRAVQRRHLRGKPR